MITNTQPLTFATLPNGTYFTFAPEVARTAPASAVTWRKIGQNAADAILRPVPCDRDGLDRPEWVGKDGIHTVITVRPEAPVAFPRVNAQILGTLTGEHAIVAEA